jgi:hypothetical protein
MAVEEIKISIAAHVVAAGIFKDKARITVSLVPIVDRNGNYDLAQWPDHADRFLAQARLYVVPVNATDGWRKPNYSNPPKLENLERKSDGDEGELGKYWQAVMGHEAGFAALAKALNPDPQKEKDPLDAVLRPGSKPDKTPDFHGTRRSKTAIKHSFERAQYTASRLKGSAPPTIVAASAGLPQECLQSSMPGTSSQAAVRALMISQRREGAIRTPEHLRAMRFAHSLPYRRNC